MGKDKRGVDRGRCKKCTCGEYEAHASRENHTCSYCECPPTQHEELPSSQNTAQASYHREEVPNCAAQTLSPHPGQLQDDCLTQENQTNNGGGPNTSQDELNAKEKESQEQDSNPNHLLGTEHVATGSGGKYNSKAGDTSNTNFEEVEPNLYSTKPLNSDSGHGTSIEHSTPPATENQYQGESLYQHQNQPQDIHTTHRCRSHKGKQQEDTWHGTKQYCDNQPCGSNEHQRYGETVRQQYFDSTQPEGEYLACQQKNGGKSSIPSTLHLQEMQGKQKKSIQNKNGSDQSFDTQGRREHHNTLPIHHQKYHQKKANGVGQNPSLPNGSQSPQRNVSLVCRPMKQLHREVTESKKQHDIQNLVHGSPSTYQEPLKCWEATAGSAQSYDSSQSCSPHISQTSPEGGKDIRSKMKHLHQKLRKLEEAQTSVKRELQNIITGAINSPVSEIENKASLEFVDYHSDNSNWKQPLIPSSSIQDKNLMEDKVILPACQNPLQFGIDASTGQQIGSSLKIRPLHGVKQSVKPAAKPLVNYDSDTDGNNQSDIEDETGKSSREKDIGSSKRSILIESSEQYLQQVPKFEDSNGTKQLPQSSEASGKQDEPVLSAEGLRKQDEPVPSSEGSKKQDEPVPSSKGSRMQDEPVSCSEGSRKKDEPVPSSEESRKQDEPVPSSKGPRMQDEPVSCSAGARKKDEPALRSEVSGKQDEPVPSSDESRKQDEPVPSSEVTRKQDEPVPSSKGSRMQDEPVSSSEGSRKKNEPVPSSEVSKKQDEPVSSAEGLRKQDELVPSSEGSKKQDEPVPSSEVSGKQDEPAPSSEVSGKQDEPAPSAEVSRKQDEPVSSAEGLRKQDELVPSSEGSKKQDEPVPNPEGSKKQDEPVPKSEGSKKQDEPVPSSEGSQKQDESVPSSEVSQKQDEPAPSSEVSQKQDEPAPSAEVSKKQDEPVSSAEGLRKQDELVPSAEGSKKQDELVPSSEGSKKQDEPVPKSEGSQKQDEPVPKSEGSQKKDEPVPNSEGSKKQDEPVPNSEVSGKQDEPAPSSEGSKKQDESVPSSEVSQNQDEPAPSSEVSGKQDEPAPSSEVLQNQDEPAPSSEVSGKQDEPALRSEGSKKQDEPVPSSEVSGKQDEPVPSSEVSGKQDEPVSSSEVSWKQDESVSSSEVSRRQDVHISNPDVLMMQEGSVTSSEESKKTVGSVSNSEESRQQETFISSSDVSKKQEASVSSSKMSRKEEEPVSSSGVSLDQGVKDSSAHRVSRMLDTTISTSDRSRSKSVSVSNSEGLEEQGVPVFNTEIVRKSVPAFSSELVNLQSDCSHIPTRLKWRDQHDTFHPTIHGKNIKIENNGTTARRDQCYTDGICFSKFPIKMGCNIHLKIVESKKFRGSMRIGFTSKNPEDVSVESLPAHSYPEVQQGFWIKPLHDKLAQQGYVVTYMVDSSGDVFYSINGEEKGLFFSGVDVSCCLWAAVDIHGSTIAVQFANDQVVSDAVSRNIHEGDQVMLHVETVETLQLLQEGHGGMQHDLEKAIRDPSTGVAIRIDDDEDVRVFYKKHNRVWCINPAALQKVGTADLSCIIREGDLVAIGNDLERIKQLQKAHGEWVETMERTLGKIGRVTKITHQGDLRLRVDGKTWTYNAKAVTKITMKKGVSGTSRHSVNCDKGLHYWKSGLAKVCTRCGECTANGADCNLRGSPFRSRGSPCGCREKTGGCADCGMCHSCAGETDDEADRKGSKMARLLKMLKRHVGEGDDSDEEEAHVIAVGDKVRVTTDAQTLPILQREGGLEWDEAMLQVIGMDGRATQVSAKSVTVHFPHHGRWCLVPGCLTKVCVRVKQKGGETYQKGELVRIITDERQLKRIQSKHGGYSRDMAAALGKTGCVMRCKDGSVKVDVTEMSWWFNPAALSRAVLKGRESLDGLHIKDGDYVRVQVDEETFKAYQVCHGGYVDRMDKSVWDFGVVHHIDIDGDAVVYYPDGTRWCINAISLGKVDPAECGQIDVSCVLEVADWVKVEDDKDRIKRVQEKTDCIRWQVRYYDTAGKVGQVRTTYPFNDVITVQIEGSGYPLNPKLLRRASPADLKEVLGSGDITNPGFNRGDLVKIAVDTNKLRVLQDGHGGFVDKMDELLELVGSVSFIDRDGDVYVRFSIRRLCFNPYSLAKVTPEEDTFHVGDLVLIEPDQERFKDLQRPTKHGRYNQKMLPACGKVGRLLNVMDQDKVRVKVLGRNWVLNPQLVTRMGNPGLGTGDWKSATICAPNKHDWSTGRCLVCVKCGECTHYGRLCPARDKPGRYPGSICGCGNGHAGCDDCGTCRSCAGEIQIHEDVYIESDGKDGHDMGWQGDAVEKLGVGGHKPTSREKADVLKKMSQAVEQLKKSENKQPTDAASIKTVLENNLLSPFTNHVSSTHKKLMGDHLANIDAARVLLDQYLKCVSAEDICDRDEETRLQFECLQLLRKLLVHGTNSSPEFCRTVGRCNLLATLLQDLSSFHKRTRDDTTWPAIYSIVTILYNCARVPENQEYFTSCNVVSILTPYLRSKDEGIRITTLSCLAFIIEGENLHLIRLNMDMAELIVSLLKDALGTPEHITTRGGNKYSALQITTIISVIVRNDENKQILVAKGMVDLLIRLIQTGDDREKESALLCIRRLADTCSHQIGAIIKRELTKVKELLLLMRKDRNVSKVVRDAVAMTVDVLEHGPPQETKGPTAAEGSISTIKRSDLLVETKTPLGGGGFGVVFRGYHRRWMMNVAVKRLKSLPKEQSLRVSEAVIEEANFMRRAQNAYRFIVPLYGVCVHENLTALVMDYMENGSVEGLLSQVKHITWWALKWRILHETILGMNFLHSLDPQIIHHDLKAQNIMLDEDFHAKISDFGLSKYKHLASKSRGTEEVSLAGTITHIPPEHILDIHLKAGEKFDVYSFGILIWEVLTGQEPYQNCQNSAHIRMGVISGQRPDKKLIPKVGPNELSFFTTQMEECWSTCPAERPQFRDLGERVQTVVQRTNAEVAVAVHAVRTALGKDLEEKKQEETQLFAADDGPDA